MKIKRKYLRNRHQEYNGKIKYRLTHQGEAKTRTSKNEYLYAAVIEVDEPSYRFDKNDNKVPHQLQYTKVIWSGKPIPESRALNEIGYRNYSNPHDSANERAAKKTDMAERIKKARRADYFKITYYQVTPNETAKHQAWKSEWSEIEELSKRDIEQEIKEITSVAEATKLMLVAKKHANIPDDKRGVIIQAARTAGMKINFFRTCRMTLEERRCPQQMIMREFIT